MSLSITQAARELGVSRPTVYAMMDDGRLPHIDGKPLADGVAKLKPATVDDLADYTVDTRTLARWLGMHRDDVLRKFKGTAQKRGKKLLWREDDAVSLAQEYAEFDFDESLFLEEVRDYKKWSRRKAIRLLKDCPLPRIRQGNRYSYRACDEQAWAQYLLEAQVWWLMHCPSDKKNRIPAPFKRVYRDRASQLVGFPRKPYGVPVWRLNDVREFLKTWDNEPIEPPEHLHDLADDDPELSAWKAVDEIAGVLRRLGMGYGRKFTARA